MSAANLLRLFVLAVGTSCGFFLALYLIDLSARGVLAWRRHRGAGLHVSHVITVGAVGVDLARALGSAEQPAAAQPEAERPALRLVR